MIEYASSTNVLLHQRRPRIERMRCELRTIPNAQLRKIEYLDGNETKQESRGNGDVLANFPISHLPPPGTFPTMPSECRRG